MSLNKDNLPRPAKGFCIKAELKMTTDKGVGSFAAEFVPANTIVMITLDECKFFDEEQALEHLASMSSLEEKRYWLSHVYGVKDKIAEDPYDQPIINHSSNPNICTAMDNGNAYALRDIEEGEEFTEDYRTFSKVPFLDRLMKEYGMDDNFVNN